MAGATQDSLAARGRNTLVRTGMTLGAVLGAVGVCWAVEIVDFILPISLDQFGIIPRSVSGLLGIVVSPFLHGSFGHLIANSFAGLGLGALVAMGGPWRFLSVSVISAVVSGGAVWLLGSGSTVTVGASGVIYGYLGYLLLAGWYSRNMLAFGGSILVAFLFGGLLWGMFPFFVASNVSWMGHFFGFVGGVLAARLLAPERN